MGLVGSSAVRGCEYDGDDAEIEDLTMQIERLLDAGMSPPRGYVRRGFGNPDPPSRRDYYRKYYEARKHDREYMDRRRALALAWDRAHRSRKGRA